MPVYIVIRLERGWMQPLWVAKQNVGRTDGWSGVDTPWTVMITKVEVWSGVTDVLLTDSQTTKYRATQLFEVIKFKLSHAMIAIIFNFLGFIMVHIVM